jgi:uncharacterized membrane protein
MLPPSFASRRDRRDDWANDVIQAQSVTDPALDPAVPPRLQDDKTLPVVIYALHIAGVATGGVTCLIGAILAYVSRKDAPEWLASHYEFQIRTFWLALMFSHLSAVLTRSGRHRPAGRRRGLGRRARRRGPVDPAEGPALSHAPRTGCSEP